MPPPAPTIHEVSDGRRCNENDGCATSGPNVPVVWVVGTVGSDNGKARFAVSDGYDGEVDMSRLYDVCVLVASLLSVVVLMIGV
jgi:hypothetical protein